MARLYVRYWVVQSSLEFHGSPGNAKFCPAEPWVRIRSAAWFRDAKLRLTRRFDRHNRKLTMHEVPRRPLDRANPRLYHLTLISVLEIVRLFDVVVCHEPLCRCTSRANQPRLGAGKIKLCSRASLLMTFLLQPRYSECVPSEVDVSTRLTHRIRLQIPLLSSPMDTVTEAEWRLVWPKKADWASFIRICRRGSDRRSAEGQTLGQRHHHRPVTLSPEERVGRAPN